MKNKFNKAACFFLSFMLIIIFANSIYAVDNEMHIHGDNCIYHCELDGIDPENVYAPPHDHIDHDGSENCIYSCSHPNNNQTFSHFVKTSEETQAFIDAVRNATTDEELNILIAEYYDIPLSDVDIAEMRQLAQKDDVSVMGSQLQENFDSLIEPNSRSADECDHYLVALACGGIHSNPNQNNCKVWCTRRVICFSTVCDYEEVVRFYETVHDWSVGWCGQTCKNCGLIELFHDPGGCSHCS